MKRIRKVFSSKFILSLLLISTFVLSAAFPLALEPPTTEWKSNFGASGATYATEVVDSSGQNDGYILIGSNCCDYNIYIIRTNDKGEPDTTFGPSADGTLEIMAPGVDKGTCIKQTFSQNGNPSGFILVGSTDSYGSGSRSILVAKLTVNGELESNWGTLDTSNPPDGVPDGITIISNQSGGSYVDPFHVIQTTDAGNKSGYVVIGSSDQIYLVKLKSNGEYFSGWGENGDGTSIFDFGNNGAYGRYVAEVLALNGKPDGYVLAGNFYHSLLPDTDMLLIRIDKDGLLDTSFGNQQPTTGYSLFGISASGSSDSGSSVKQTFDSGGNPSGFIVGGSTTSYGGSDNDLFLVKTDGSGIAEPGWGPTNEGYTTIGGDKSDNGYEVDQTSDGGYVICGNTSSYKIGHTVYSDSYMAKVTLDGKQKEWDRVFDSYYSNLSMSVQETTDGGFVLSRTDGMTIIKASPPGTTTIFEKGYGGNGDFRAGVETSQNGVPGYLAAGWMSEEVSPGIWDEQVYLVKTDKYGVPDTTWGNQNPKDGTSKIGNIPSVQYGSRERAFDIIEVTNPTTQQPDGYLVVGKATLPNSTDTDVYVVRVDANGSVMASWEGGGELTFDAGNNELDQGYSVKQLADGKFIILGETYRYNPTYKPDMYLIKLNYDGTTYWEKPIFEDGYQYAKSVIEHSSGNIYALGRSGGMLLVKFDSSGNKLNSWIYHSNAVGESIIEINDTQNSLILFGYAGNAGSSDMYLVKVDPNGVPASGWGTSGLGYSYFGGNGQDLGYSLQQMQDGGYILCGSGFHEVSPGGGYWGVYLVKADSEGNEVWGKVKGAADSSGYDIKLTSDNGLLISGSGGSGKPGAYLIKSDINGNFYD